MTNSTLPAPLSSLKEHAILGILGTTFLSVLGLTMPFITMQLRSPLPYMGTPIHKIDKALQFILVRHSQKQQQQKAMMQARTKTLSTSSLLFTNSSSNNTHGNGLIIPPPRYVDLGSGDGSSVLHAAKLGYIATGIELNTTLFLLSILSRQYHQIFNNTTTTTSPSTTTNNNMIRTPTFTPQRAKFIYGNMFQANSIIQKSIQNANVIMIFGVPSLMNQIASLLNTNCKVGCYIMSYRFRIPLLLSSPPSTASFTHTAAATTAASEVKADNANSSSNERRKKWKDEDDSTTTVKKDDGNISILGDVDGRRIIGSNCSNSVVDAILIYDDEEMRIYEIQRHC